MSFEKIPMKTPLVEMDGDEMTRVIWQLIKDMLLAPYIDLNLEYYDLGLPEREAHIGKFSLFRCEEVIRLCNSCFPALDKVS